MPHITVELYKGRNNEIKEVLAKRLQETIVEVLGSNPDSVSVSITDIEPSAWMDLVYKEKIEGNPDVFIKPNYKK